MQLFKFMMCTVFILNSFQQCEVEVKSSRLYSVYLSERVMDLVIDLST